jgi:hypothetical protein
VGEATLVVRLDDVGEIIAALTRTHDDVVSMIDALRRDVAAHLVGWDPTTESRVAQLAYDARLGRGVDDLTRALVAVRDALRTVATDAHQAEVRNVAILD